MFPKAEIFIKEEDRIMAIRLFQSQTSMFCEKIRIVLAVKNVPYKVVDVKKDSSNILGRGRSP